MEVQRRRHADHVHAALRASPSATASTLDADAVAKSLNRSHTDPKSLVAAQLANVASITATDASTVVIQLLQADYQVPNLLAGKTGMIVNPAVFASDAAGLATQPAGAGPFNLTSYTQNASATLVANPRYWDATNIKIKNFQLYPLPDASTVVAGLSSGQYNVAQIPGSQVAAAKAAGLEVQVISSLVVATLDTNIGKAPFDDPQVVQALHYALDRKALLQTANFGYGDVSYQPFPKGYAGYNPALDGVYAYNPDKAKQLLAASTYAGKPVPVEITTSAAEGVPEQVQAQLNAVGFTATINVIPAAQFTPLVYIQHAEALTVDAFAGRDSAVQAFQVLFGGQGLMNPGRVQSPELVDGAGEGQPDPARRPDLPERPAGRDRNRRTDDAEQLPLHRAADPRAEHVRLGAPAVHGGPAIRGGDRVMTTVLEVLPAAAVTTAAPVARDPQPARSKRRIRATVRSLSVPVVVFAFASFLTFWLGSLSPSNPAAAVLGDTATPADIVRMNHQFGLDRPFLVQYVTWLGHALTGDLGRSYFTTIPVGTSIANALPVDLQLAGLALLLAVLIGGSAGIVAALRQGSRLDRGGHARGLGVRHAAAVRGRRRPDRHLLGDAQGAAGRRLRAAVGRSAAVAAVRDPARARAEPGDRRVDRPPAAHVAGRRSWARTT